MTTYDFGRGPVPAHQHINPDGSLGGWVADTVIIGENVFIHPLATVGPACSLGGYCFVGERCILRVGCSLGHGCSLGNGCSLGDGCSLGNSCSLGNGCSLGYGCSIGNRCSFGRGLVINERCRFTTSPVQIHLPCTIVYIPEPGVICSGCVKLTFEMATPERIRIECEKAGYTEETTKQYVNTIAWLIEGARNGILYQGEKI